VNIVRAPPEDPREHRAVSSRASVAPADLADDVRQPSLEGCAVRLIDISLGGAPKYLGNRHALGSRDRTKSGFERSI
jgi:hypothetical protein